MRKIAFVFSCLSIFIGTIVIIVTSILNEIMPKLGYIVFQASSSGSYDPNWYKMNFSLPNIIAVIMIIVGILASLKIYYTTLNK